MLFGTSIAGALAHQASFGAHSPDLDFEIPLLIPALLRNIVDHRGHRTDGIFRVSPPSSQLESLMAELEDGNYGLEERNPHANAALIKIWLRTLAEPIIPFEQYDAMIAIGRQPTFNFAQNKADADRMQAVTATLSSPNAKSLLTLLLFLQRLSTFEAATKMGQKQLGEAFANVLVRCADPKREQANTQAAATFVERLIAATPKCFKNEEQALHPAADTVIKFLFVDEEEVAAPVQQQQSSPRPLNIPDEEPAAAITTVPVSRQQSFANAAPAPAPAPAPVAAAAPAPAPAPAAGRAPSSASGSWFQPDPSLPREQQLRQMEVYLLGELVRGDVAMTYYEPGTGKQHLGTVLGYRVTAPGQSSSPQPPSQIDPPLSDENKSGGIWWRLPGESTFTAARCIRLLDIKKIVDGKIESATWATGEAAARANPSCCFSIVSKTATLDVEATTPRQKLEWIYGIRVLMGAIGRGQWAGSGVHVSGAKHRSSVPISHRSCCFVRCRFLSCVCARSQSDGGSSAQGKLVNPMQSTQTLSHSSPQPSLLSHFSPLSSLTANFQLAQFTMIPPALSYHPLPLNSHSALSSVHHSLPSLCVRLVSRFSFSSRPFCLASCFPSPLISPESAHAQLFFQLLPLRTRRLSLPSQHPCTERHSFANIDLELELAIDRDIEMHARARPTYTLIACMRWRETRARD